MHYAKLALLLLTRASCGVARAVKFWLGSCRCVCMCVCACVCVYVCVCDVCVFV